MKNEQETEQKIPQRKIIEMIEEFVGCLNYPATQAMLAKEKNRDKFKEMEMEMEKKGEIQCGKIQGGGEMVGEEVGGKVMEDEDGRDGKETEKVQEERHGDGSVGKIEEKMEEKQNQKEQFAWKLEDAKYYSKFATFSQIVCLLETSAAQRQMAQATLRQKQLQNTNNQILQSSINSKPTLLHLFSAFDTISRVKEFTLPIHRNLSLQLKFGKQAKLMQCSPKQNYLFIVDESSTPTLINLQQRTSIPLTKQKQYENITAIKWLNSGSMVVLGNSVGKLVVLAVLQGKSVDRVKLMELHQGDITCMYCNKDYLYTCATDYTIAKIHIRTWNKQRIVKLRCNWFRKIVKIQHKKLKDVIIGIDADGAEVIMMDELTGFTTTLFSIKRNHIPQCQKISQKKQHPLKPSQISKTTQITDLLLNPESDTLIISISGINPSIYEIDPLRNETTLHLNYKNLKCPFVPAGILADLEQGVGHRGGKDGRNLFICLSHRAEVLVVAVGGAGLVYVRLKNWRVLYQFVDDRGVVFGMLASTRRHPEVDQSLLFPTIDTPKPQPPHPQIPPQKQPILCCQNLSNGNIQIYYNTKMQLKTIRTDIVRNRPFLGASMGTGGFPNSAQGFLELLQTIRENYQAFV